MDVGDWLRSQNLGKYEEAFRENAIDLDVLTDLTDGDLAQIGVALGDRKRLLKAIAGFPVSGPISTPQGSAPPPAPADRANPASVSSAERRPITVMFCDLVGSTALAAKLDAEDWRELVGAYLDAASEAVTQYGGHVLKKLGDGLMALFGYPKALENDAERAARAGLAILAALEALNARNAGKGWPALAARIGLDMGPVVVDSTGEVFGEAPNVAARAQAAAEPGQALVTAAVQRHIAGLFVVEDKGAHALKGVPAPVTLYRIVRASGGGRRGGARALTLFVGREEDLALLARRWERAKGGEGQFVQIVGEPGLGKSRLVEEFHARLGATPHTWVEWSSSQLLQNTPLHPLADWGRLRFGGADVAAEKRLAELESTLAQVKLDAGETAALLAPLLDIPLPEARALKLAPEELRRRQLAAVAAWILAGARTQALVLAFEDLHWADPTTLDLMKTLVERGAAAPFFVVATTRPEFRAPWATRSHHGIVSLVPLDRAEIRTMVGAIAERHALSNEVMEGVTNRTGGVPLFVEEVTRLLLEGGPQTIPPTLQQSLAARLDRLGEAREVAQIGAVLGREFSYGLLASVAAVADRGAAPSTLLRMVPLPRSAGEDTPGAGASVLPRAAEEGDRPKGGGGGYNRGAPVDAVDDRVSRDHRSRLQSGLSEAALESALDKLAEADLLFVEGHAPDSTYRFKHALIQDAAYESLLKSRRQALHRRAAEALLAAPDPQPELVAHHFTQAGESEPAIEWWGRAGDAALRRSAFQEAIAHLGKAIEMADAQPGAKERSQLKLEVSRANALMASRGQGATETAAGEPRAKLHSDFALANLMGKGFTSEAARAALARAEAHVEGAGTPEYWRQHYGRLAGALVGAKLSTARERAAALLAEAEAAGEPGHAGVARRMLGAAKILSGDFVGAAADLRRAVAEYDEARDAGLNALYGHDLFANAQATLAHALWYVGEIDEAERLAAAALARAEAAGSAVSQIQALFCRLVFAGHTQRYDLLGDVARQIVALAEAHDIEYWRNAGNENLLWLQALRGETPADAYREHLARPIENGDRRMDSTRFRLLARFEYELGRNEAALAAVEQALALAAESGEGEFETAHFRLRAFAARDPAAAEADHRRAMDVAHAQGSPTLALLCALELARFLIGAERRLEANDVLSAALQGLAPTPHLPAIGEAQALVAELEQSDAVRSIASRRDRDLAIQTGYAQAMLAVKGYAAEQTQRANERIRGAASAVRGPEHWTRLDIEWAVQTFAGRLREAQSIAENFLREAETAGDRAAAWDAKRLLGFVKVFMGEFVVGRELLDGVLASITEEQASALSLTHVDFLCDTWAISAHISFALGEMDDWARSLALAIARAKSIGHTLSLAVAMGARVLSLSAQGRAEAAHAQGAELNELAEKNGFGFWAKAARIAMTWAKGRLGDEAATNELRDLILEYEHGGSRLMLPLFLKLLAELEAASGARDAGLASAARGLEVMNATNERRYEAPLHLTRAEILASEDPAASEAAFLEALRVARKQGARGYELRIALGLAKFYETNGRSLEAYDALAPAVEGFSPTTEFPALAESQALLAALAESGEVKADAGRRETRSKLHSGYALATMMTKGFGAEETKAALARAAGASRVAKTPEYWTVRYGRLVGDLMAAKFDAMRGGAIAFIAEAEAAGQPGHASVARRILGFAKIVTGDFAGAGADLRRAVAEFDDARDAELNAYYGHDLLANALATLAQATWYLGDVDEAERLADAAIARAETSGRVVSQIQAIACRNFFALQTDRPEILLENARKILGLAERHELAFWKTFAGESLLSSRACLGEPCADAYREDFERRPDFGGRLMSGLRYTVLARVERAVGRTPEALAGIERALAIGAENGEGEFTTLSLRLRADIRAELEPAAAEADFYAALDLARAQGSPTLALLAALDLAKFLRTRSREREAYDALAPSLDGLAPTPNLPAIAEAHALLAALAETDAVRADRRNRGLRAKYAQAVYIAEGATAAATKAAFDRVDLQDFAKLSETEHVTALYGHFLQAVMSGRLREGLPIAEAALRDGEAANRNMVVAVAHRLKSVAQYYLGSFAAALRSAEQALSRIDERWAAAHRVALGNDILCQTQSIVAQALGPLGESEASARHVAEAERRAQETGEPFIIASVHVQDLVRLWAANLPAATERVAQALGAVTSASGIGAWDLTARLFGAWASGRLADPAAAMQTVRECWEQLRQRDARFYDPIALVMLADLAASAGMGEDALRYVAEGLEVAAAQGRRICARAAPSPARPGPGLDSRGGRRRRLPRIDPHCARAGRANLRAASRPPVRAVPPIKQSLHRRPRRPRRGARRLFAHLRVPRHRRRAGAARGACRDGRGEGRSGAARAACAASDRHGDRLAPGPGHADA